MGVLDGEIKPKGTLRRPSIIGGKGGKTLTEAGKRGGGESYWAKRRHVLGGVRGGKEGRGEASLCSGGRDYRFRDHVEKATIKKFVGKKNFLNTDWNVGGKEVIGGD